MSTIECLDIVWDVDGAWSYGCARDGDIRQSL